MSTWHIVLLLVVVLVVFGTGKLKNLGPDLGSAIKGFKKSMEDGEAKEVKPFQTLEKKDADFNAANQASNKAENKSTNS